MKHGPSPLWMLGALVCLAGLMGTGYFVAGFDTTVATSIASMPRVNNLGLMADRQNGLIVSVGAAIVGVILLLAGELGGRQQRSHARVVQGGLECPSWGLFSPTIADRCDCGFAFR